MTFTTFLVGAAGCIALVAASALLLPRPVQIERAAVIKSPPEATLALAGSNRGYQVFNPYQTADADLKITLFGPQTGIGSGFHFDGKDGKGSQIIAGITGDQVTYDIDLGAMGRPVQHISARATTGGSMVTWRMEADLGMNPIARVFGPFMDRMIGNTLEQGLGNLANAA